MSGHVTGGGQTVALRRMQPWRLVLLLIFTQIPGVLSYTIALPLLAVMSGELAHDASSEYLVKMIMGIVGPAMAVGSLVAGLLADRMDRRLLTLVVSGLYLVSGIVPVFVSSLDAIVASRALLGFAGGALMATGYTMAGDYLPEERRAKTIGVMNAAGLVASLASMWLSGQVAQFGWRAAFLLYLCALPLVLLALPSALPAPGKSTEAKAGAPARSWFGGMPWGLLVIALGTGVILAVPGIYASYHLASIRLGKPGTVAMIMMLNSASAAVASALFGKALEKASQRVVFTGAFGLMAFGLVLYAFAVDLMLVLPAMVLMGATLGILAPGMPALAVERAAEGNRGKVVGMVQAVGAVASIVGLSLLEPLMPSYGTRGVMVAIAALSALLMLPFLLQRRAR